MRSATVPLSPEPVLPPGEEIAPRHVPFTVIDEAVHVLDTAAEPWSIQLEVGLGGQLDEGRLRRAVRAALARHPMARARRLPARHTDRTWTWEIVPEADLDPVRVVECPDEATLARAREDLYSRQVPLVEAPPLRLLVAREPEHDRLLLAVNHAAFDGFGCVRFLRSVALAYTGRDDPEPPVEFDEVRDVRRLVAAPDRDTRVRRLQVLGSKLSDLAVRPARLAEDGGSDRPGYGFHQFVLSEEQTARLKRDDGPTVNDVLLAALHLAISEWNEAHDRRAGRVSVLEPVNVRPKDWQDDVVTNLVLEARVVTSAADRTDARALLEAVAAQSQRIKQGGGAALIEAIGGWRSMPLWTKQPLSPLLWLTGNRLIDTALLTNLEQLKDPPDFGPEGGATTDAWFSAPARLPCGLSVGAVTVGGRLHLTFRYRHPMLGAAAAARFADRFVEALERVAEE